MTHHDPGTVDTDVPVRQGDAPSGPTAPIIES